MRKALVIGINEYGGKNSLMGCVNDAFEMDRILSYNGDKDTTVNFDVKRIVDKAASKTKILEELSNLFNCDVDIALFYFSGHGDDNKNDGAIVSVDMESIPFNQIMKIVNNSPAKYKVVILDCCYSGRIGQIQQIGDMSVLSENTLILTACSPSEVAIDDQVSKHGTFTKLLLGALEGGSSDILGRVTAGSIYSYIDQALGAWEQRPYFKANVSSFSPIRYVEPKIELRILKKGLNLFLKEDDKFQLNPSYEETNYKKNKNHKAKKPFAVNSNVENMKILQTLNQNGLVIPSNEHYMYYAAMNSDTVELTNLGKHYWNLFKSGRI